MMRKLLVKWGSGTKPKSFACYVTRGIPYATTLRMGGLKGNWIYQFCQMGRRFKGDPFHSAWAGKEAGGKVQDNGQTILWLKKEQRIGYLNKEIWSYSMTLFQLGN